MLGHREQQSPHLIAQSLPLPALVLEGSKVSLAHAQLATSGIGVDLHV